MKHADTPTPDGSTVLKFDMPGLLSAQSETGLDGEYIWPIAPNALATLYRASAEHGRAIQIKAESAFGGGLQGERAGELDALVETGIADLLVSLGLDLETFGNAFLQIIWSRDKSRILSLRRLPAITMSRFRAGFLQRVTLPNGDSKKITFSADEIIHLKEPCPMGRRYAYPTWIGVEGMMELAHAAIRFNAAFFKNNAMPEYAIIFKGGTPSKAQKNAIQDFFRNEYQGLDNAHRTLILNHNEDQEIKIERLTSEVKDGDFLKLIDAARDRMPVAHGVPSRMLGIMTAGQLGGGGEVSGQLFIFEHLTLRPKRRRMLDQMRGVLKILGLEQGNIEDGLTKNQIAFRPLDLTPPKDDAENLPELVTSGILTTDEARAFLPALQGLSKAAQDAATAPVARRAPVTPIDRLAEILGQL